MPKAVAAPSEVASAYQPVSVADEIKNSFVPYALSVIASRAIPDARDGLKPVQRRILYAMHKMGLKPGGPRRKSAGVVGEVMGSYHPHGDSAIYEAMVRMGQPHVMVLPLIEGKGNFGSADDPPAAYRYTEARLAEGAPAMLAGVDSGSVDTISTFDGANQEPVVLPAILPNLLVNGASGIAVGMSTSIPPHNLGEVVEAASALLSAPARKTPKLMDLLKIIPAPDFPGGGIISDTSEIVEIYETGKGKFALRGICKSETVTPKRKRIVVTELPYLVGAERLISQIDSQIEAGKLDTVIASAENLSDKNGTRIHIDMKLGVEPAKALAYLHKHTDLEINVNVNMVATIDGQPRTMGLIEMLEVFNNHIIDVTTRKAQTERDKAAARAHRLKALVAAADKSKKLIDVITSATTDKATVAGVRKLLNVDEEQADAVLSMPLRRLSKLNKNKLSTELNTELKIVAKNEKLLASPLRIKRAAESDMRQAAEKLIAPRRTRIQK